MDIVILGLPSSLAGRLSIRCHRGLPDRYQLAEPFMSRIL
jgi:hypothetical protein